MRKTISLVLTSLLLVPGFARAGRPVGPPPEPPAARPGRTVQVPALVGGAAIYLPAGHDPERLWPLVVFLPPHQLPPEKWLESWKAPADRLGVVVAVPVPSKPDIPAGYSDLTVVGLVRAACQAAAIDPERVALVGHRAAGSGASRTVFSYPRLVRAVVVVGSAPAGIRAADDLVPRLPAFLFLSEDKHVRNDIRTYRKACPKLRITDAVMRDAEGPFGAEAAARALRWLAGRFPPGPGPRPESAAPERDPERSARLVARAAELRVRGAEAGAYVTLFGAARLDAGSVPARLELARLCLAGRRLAECLEWSRAAAGIKRREPAAHLLAAEALLRLGNADEALGELRAAGRAGRRLRALVEKRRAELAVGAVTAAPGHYRRAAEKLAGGDYPAAAAAARAAVRAAPCEAAHHALAACAVSAAEGPAAAEQLLADYLELFPRDPYVKPLAGALAATRAKDYSTKDLPPKAEVLLGQVLPAGAGAGLLAAMCAKAGLPGRAEKLAGQFAARGANRDPRLALPLLAEQGLSFAVGRGSLPDLRRKLAGGAAVLLQMPPGALAGLRPAERFSSGLPRLAVGYDDAAKCVLLRDYGAAEPLPVPYELFDMLWSRLDRWWLVVRPPRTGVPGQPGELTGLELAAARAAGGDPAGALKELEAEGAATADPPRARLLKAQCLIRTKKPDAARKELAGLSAAPPEYAAEARRLLGIIEEGGGAGSRQERIARALPHYRKAWEIAPGSPGARFFLAAALLGRGGEGDLAEARQMLEDYLRYRPASVAALRLLYSR